MPNPDFTILRTAEDFFVRAFAVPHRPEAPGGGQVFIARRHKICYHNGMRQLSEQEKKTASELLLRCTEVLPEGFRIDLAADSEGWAAASRALGSKRLCAFVAETLKDMYREQFSETFLFSARCMAFELKYHLNAYLCVKGFRHTRHVTTLLFRPALIERKCRSVEIDTNDVYRLTQRIAFRYFFGIDREYRRTDRDPYAVKCGNQHVRVPFYRLRG